MWPLAKEAFADAGGRHVSFKIYAGVSVVLSACRSRFEAAMRLPL
jgi:hypothetical protein